MYILPEHDQKPTAGQLEQKKETVCFDTVLPHLKWLPTKEVTLVQHKVESIRQQTALLETSKN